MPAFLVKDLPPFLHERLRQEATRHHRSMNREVITILEKELGATMPIEFPPPVKPLVPVDGREIAHGIRTARVRSIPAFKAYKGRFSLTNEFIDAAKREGRA